MKYYNTIQFHHQNLGISAIQDGIKITSSKTNVPYHIVKYHKMKALKPELHPFSHGGRRYTKYNDYTVTIIKSILLILSNMKTTLNINQICDLLNSILLLSSPIKSWNVSKWIDELDLSFKVPSRFQHHKFSDNNMMNYQIFLQLIKDFPLRKIKFIDESHFYPKELQKKKVLSKKGLYFIIK